MRRRALFCLPLLVLTVIVPRSLAAPEPAPRIPPNYGSITLNAASAAADRMHATDAFYEGLARSQFYAAVAQNIADEQARVAAAEAAKQQARAQERSVRFVATPTGGSHKGYATAKECVANTENGGDYGRSSNGSHFGRYQFSYNAWVNFGGDPNTWGSASPAEQDQVFENAWSQGPSVQWQQWLRWDGCG